jgi:cell division protease FtsH
MFSIANNFTAPPVKIASERKPEYHPRTYSQFVKGLKNKELPAVIVKPSENVAQFQEENGDYGDVRIVQTEQLWQTLMDSDAEVLVDTSGPPMSFAETGIVVILGIYLFSVLRAIFLWEVH